MKLFARFAELPVFWKIYLSFILLMLFTMLFMETCFAVWGQFPEPEWYSSGGILTIIGIWLITGIIPAMILGFFLAGYVTARLKNLLWISNDFALGNLKARAPARQTGGDEFELLARNFNTMAETIEQQIDIERRLTAAVSHELRTPLARMGLVSEILQVRMDSAQGSDMLPRLDKEIWRMRSLVEQLLVQARDKFQGIGDKGQIDLAAMLRSIALDFDFLGKPEGKAVRLEASSRLFVAGRSYMIRRIFDNIMMNAVRYAPRGSSIELEAKEQGDWVAVSIRDYGPGVPENALEAMFLSFVRFDEEGEGTGLGLSLAREAAMYHGGDIHAENMHPGLKVTVILPLARDGGAYSDRGNAEKPGAALIDGP